MSVASDILRTYRAPREVLRRRLLGGAREDRALAILMAACLLIFVAQWPRLSREAFVDDTIALEALMAGALFGWIFVAPLAFYALALMTHWALRLSGITSSPYASRMALFWALLAAAPLWLLTGLMAGFAGPGVALNLVGVVAFGAFLVFWIAGIFEIGRYRKEEHV